MMRTRAANNFGKGMRKAEEKLREMKVEMIIEN